MPNSAYQNTAFVLDYVSGLEPKSILDVGAGFGRWGFLCRCHIAGGYSLVELPKQELVIDAVEVFRPNISPVYDAVYNHVYHGDIREVIQDLGQYDVIICGDMIEHLEKCEGLRLVDEMKKHCNMALVLSIPFGFCPQGVVHGNEYEVHRSSWGSRDFKGANVLIKPFPFSDNVQIGVVIYSISDHARWRAKTLQNPLRIWVARKFPKFMRKMRFIVDRIRIILGGSKNRYDH